ncbi:S4 domain-containing protein, partial [Acinetobacter baumannii]
VRGEDAARAAEATAAATFAGNGLGQDLPTLALGEGTISLVEALTGLGFAASKGEAKRLIAGGGARVDGVAVTDDAYQIVLSQG